MQLIPEKFHAIYSQFNKFFSWKLMNKNLNTGRLW